MMAAKPNPDPARITAAMWRLWTEFDAHHPAVLLGGIYAHKSGYHSTRSDNQRNWPGDYSIGFAADRKGPADKSAAIDLTFPEAQRGDYTNMRKYTARLDAAARARDPRLWVGGTPVLREVIGTLDGRRTYAYDLQRRRSDNNRDSSHMWHIHLSVTRQFVDDWDALAGVLAVLTSGEIEGDDDPMLGLKLGDQGERVEYLQGMLKRAGFDPGAVDGVYGKATSAALYKLRKADTPDTTAKDGDEVTPYALIHIMTAFAKAQGGKGERGEKGDKGDPGEPGKTPTKFTITGTATAA